MDDELKPWAGPIAAPDSAELAEAGYDIAITSRANSYMTVAPVNVDGGSDFI